MAERSAVTTLLYLGVRVVSFWFESQRVIIRHVKGDLILYRHVAVEHVVLDRDGSCTNNLHPVTQQLDFVCVCVFGYGECL